MKKITKELLKFTARVSEKMAIKSCGATSLLDSYQPKVPDAVRQLKEQESLKK